jgi:hypothetical protein
LIVTNINSIPEIIWYIGSNPKPPFPESILEIIDGIRNAHDFLNKSFLINVLRDLILFLETPLEFL